MVNNQARLQIFCLVPTHLSAEVQSQNRVTAYLAMSFGFTNCSCTQQESMQISTATTLEKAAGRYWAPRLPTVDLQNQLHWTIIVSFTTLIDYDEFAEEEI